jgi:hypothetical protein
LQLTLNRSSFRDVPDVSIRWNTTTRNIANIEDNSKTIQGVLEKWQQTRSKIDDLSNNVHYVHDILEFPINTAHNKSANALILIRKVEKAIEAAEEKPSGDEEKLVGDEEKPVGDDPSSSTSMQTSSSSVVEAGE